MNETNRAVAEALGWKILQMWEVSGDRCNGAGFVVENGARLLLPPALSWWSPSTIVAHAIDALTAFASARGLLWCAGPATAKGDEFFCELGDSLGLERRAATLPEAICQAILAAKEARDG